MDEVWYMYEEWYDWHQSADFERSANGKATVQAHFVGPMADTPRWIYLRTDQSADFSAVNLEFLQHNGKNIDTECTPMTVDGCPPGKRWWRLGGGRWVRGYAELALIPAAGATLPPFDYVLVNPNERYLTHGRAEQWVRDHERGKNVRCGVPMGGIGAGKIELSRDGWFRNITINNNLDAPFYAPAQCFSALWVKTGEKTMACALRDEAVMGLPPVEQLDFIGKYPVAQLKYKDKDLPVAVQLTAFSPIIPYNVDDSALPGVVLEFEVANNTQAPVETAVAMSWENLLGCGGRPQPGRLWGQTAHYIRWRQQTGNTQTDLRTERLSGVQFSCGPKQEPDGAGQYVLAAPTESGVDISTVLGIGEGPQGESVWRAFAQTGRFPLVESTQGLYSAALSVRLKLQPGETRRIPLVLAWYMAHNHQMSKQDLGNWYTNRFANAVEVADYLLKNRETLYRGTRAWHQLIETSSLPAWFQDMLVNSAYVTSTDTYFVKDGRFTVNEGATNMYGVMGTMDQKFYASNFLALMFPTLQQQELLAFARLQNADGRITHDVGCGEFNEKSGAFDWPDLNAAFIILSHQVYRLTNNQEFWAKIKPNVERAIEGMGGPGHDPNAQGIPTGGSTFDDERSYPLMSYHATLWLCVLQLARESALAAGDAQSASTYAARLEQARALAMKELWTEDGKYFRYGVDIEGGSKSANSHVSALSGEFYGGLLGLGEQYAPAIRNQALASLFRLHANANYKLPPKLVGPDGKVPFASGNYSHFAPVSWPLHTRVMLCGNAFLYGQEQAGYDLLKRMEDTMRSVNGDPWDESLYYMPESGKLDWGVFYMTAPSCWLAFQAFAGFDYNAVTNTLRLKPAAQKVLGACTLPVFTPGVWGALKVSADGRNLQFTVTSVFNGGTGVAPLSRIVTDPAHTRSAVKLNDEILAGTCQTGVVALSVPAQLKAGSVLEIVLE